MRRWGAFIEHMAAGSTKQWRQITMRMVWAYRLQAHESPEGVREWVRLLPEREEWDAVRKEVTRRRRRAMERKKYPTKSDIEALQAKKRHYMREYMRAYRAGKRKPMSVENRSIS